MDFGGPVWHASVAKSPVSVLKIIAERALTGVGSALLGEWRESTPLAYHLRRRLTPKEQELVGPVLDIRGTGEAMIRLAKVKDWLPAGWADEENAKSPELI